MFLRYNRRRSRKGLWPLLSRFFYINPEKQYMLIIGSAVGMAVLVFSGILLFRQSDQSDLMTQGNWYMRQGKVAFAAEEFERAVQNDRNSYEAHLALGKAYMATDQHEKAAREFRAASLLQSHNLKASGAHIAISRMMIAEGKFDDAEKQLFQAYNARPQNQHDPELLSALSDLYEDWGDSFVSATPPDFKDAYIKYSQGLHYVHNSDQQDDLSKKLVKAANHLSDHYSNNKDYDKAIAVLKYALHYDYSPDNLIAIAALCEQKGDLDSAIEWYRKAYQQDPNVISLKLSSMLIQKGQELNEMHRPDDAQKYFDEAKQINQTVKLPLNSLYPVEADNITLTYKVNPASFDITPDAKFDILNDSNYPINFLVIRAFFMSGNDKLGDAQKVIASSQNVLPSHNDPLSRRSMDMTPISTIPLEDLVDGKLAVRIMASYSDGTDAKWFDVKTLEIPVPEAAKMQSGHKKSS